MAIQKCDRCYKELKHWKEYNGTIWVEPCTCVPIDDSYLRLKIYREIKQQIKTIIFDTKGD